MIILNRKDLKEIQKIRELELKGSTKEQLAHVLDIQESNADELKDVSTELTLISAAQFAEITQALVELTEMVATLQAK